MKTAFILILVALAGCSKPPSLPPPTHKFPVSRMMISRGTNGITVHIKPGLVLDEQWITLKPIDPETPWWFDTEFDYERRERWLEFTLPDPTNQ